VFTWRFLGASHDLFEAVSSLTLETINTRPRTCLRCGGLFRIAYPESLEERAQILKACHEVGIFASIKIVQALTDSRLEDAKGTSMHISITPGKCHRCRHDILEEEFVDCPKCETLNIQPNVKL